MRLAEQSLALAEQTGAPFLKTVGLDSFAVALIQSGDCQQAEQRARELLTLCRAHGNRLGVARASWLIGQALAGQGSYVRARAFLRRTLVFARETGEIVVEAVHHLGNVELALGNLVEASRLYREMLRLCEGWEFSYGLVATLTGNARVALAARELTESRAYLVRAFEDTSAVVPDRSHDLGSRGHGGDRTSRGTAGSSGRAVRRPVELAYHATLHAEHRTAPATGTGGTLAETGSAVVGGSLRHGRRPGSSALCGGDCVGVVGGELAPPRGQRQADPPRYECYAAQRRDRAQPSARHHAWIESFYPCSAKMYRGLGETYVDDPRFTATYDKGRPVPAVFMLEAMAYHAEHTLTK